MANSKSPTCSPFPKWVSPDITDVIGRSNIPREWNLFVLISDEQGTKSPSISGHSFSVGFCRGLKAGMAELIHSEI
jgi:hypothetical protein